MKMKNKLSAKGFTLIELMIVVAIIGILAAIAVPKFADLITKSKESSAKGSLGAMRSAISIYYSDTDGIYPGGTAAGVDLVTSLTTNGKYLNAIPGVSIPNSGTAVPGSHSLSSAIFIEAGAAMGNDAGGWVYAGPAAGVDQGVIAVNCSHTDTKGSTWTSW